MCGLAKDRWQTGEQGSNQGKSEWRPRCGDLEKAERRAHRGGSEQDLLRGENCSLNKCLSWEKRRIRVLGSNLDYPFSICLWLASVSCEVGQGTEQGAWTFGEHTSEQSPQTPSTSKLSQLNVLKTIAHKSGQERHPAFLSILPFSSRALDPQQALGEQSQGRAGPCSAGGHRSPAGWAEDPRRSLPQGKWTRISCCVLAARAQAVSPGYVNSSANEFMKMLASYRRSAAASKWW